MRVAKEIETLVPYQPGKPISETKREYGLTDVIKLASNENPLGTNPKVIQAVQQALENQHLYPDPSAYELLGVIEKKWGVARKNLAIGNGSNEIIDLLIRIFCNAGDRILTTQYAFVAYAVCAQVARVQTLFAPTTKNLAVDLDAMAKMLREDTAKKIKLVFIPNPNNPTGTYVGKAKVLEFLQEFGNEPDRLIIFDEAYNEFARASDYSSAQGLMAQFSSIVLIRTLSKAYGLAGFRVGVLVAPDEVIGYFNRCRIPFNVSDLAQVASAAAMQDDEFISKAVKNNSEGLDYFYAELRKLDLPFVESQGNFVMFDTRRDVKLVHEALLHQGIILRPLLNYGFKTEMRMSVGLPAENQKAIQALRKVLQTIPAL